MVNYEEKTTIRKGVVEVALSGRLTSNDLPRGTNFFEKHVQRCLEEGSRHLLIDISKLKAIITDGDMMKAGLDAAECQSQGLKLAIVVRPDQHTPQQYFEHMAASRGGSILVTTDRAEARRWLAETEAVPSVERDRAKHGRE